MDESQNDLLNLEYLRDLSGDDEEFIQELLGDFLTDLEERIQLLQQTVERNEFENRKSCAHAIRGAAQNVGAVILVEDCTVLENDPRCDEDQELCALHLNALQEKFERAKSHIMLYIAS